MKLKAALASADPELLSVFPLKLRTAFLWFGIPNGPTLLFSRPQILKVGNAIQHQSVPSFNCFTF